MESVNITYLWRGKKTVLGLPIGATKYAVSEEKIFIEKGAMNTEEKEYQKNKRNLLKKEMKTKEFKKIIPQKLRYMSYLSSYCPGIMKIIYKIYDLKTGASKKYAINEE